MSSTQFNLLLLLFTLTVLVRVRVYSNHTSESTPPSLRLARDTNGQVRLSTPQECFRSCDGARPLYCYYKFRLEYYMTMGPACKQCRTDSFARSKNQSSCQCILADGFEKTIFSINRQFPGPSIQVCQYDKVIVDVENAAEGTDTTIHWHGVFQKNYQYYDGVPHLTQCPISAPNTFRYQFSVDNAGTHFYHSHSSLFLIDGQQGPLIVRSPKSKDPNGRLYDEDLFDHVIFLSDWLHSVSLDLYPGGIEKPGQAPDNMLINGHGDWTNTTNGVNTGTPLSFFRVSRNKRYRFRMINSFGTVCPVSLSIEKHRMTLIATDGENLKPQVVDRIVSTSGERYDFVLNANQNGGSYWIHLRGLGECSEQKKVSQVAVLVYDNNVVLPKTPRPAYNTVLSGPVEVNTLKSTNCMTSNIGNDICVNQLKYGDPVPQNELRTYPNIRLFIPFNFFTLDARVFRQNQYIPFYNAIDGSQTNTQVSNITYSEPPSPLISQYDGYNKICGANDVSTCTKPCICTHVINLPLNNVVEIVLCDEDPFPSLHHPFHLHGYSFQVMAIREYGGRKPTRDEINQFIKDHDNALANGKYDRPARKDTIKVPVGGCAIIRFYTNNPGWWLFHCHFLWHTMSGMDVVIHVGNESDMPPVPNNFPRCGNYVPQVYI